MSGLLMGQVVVDLGKFDSEEAAARAHDRAAVWCLGLTATTNFPAADWALQVSASTATSISGTLQNGLLSPRCQVLERLGPCKLQTPSLPQAPGHH